MPKQRSPRRQITNPKLTRPASLGAYRRERVLARLVALDQAPVLWIAGPPGSGKTTLISTWLESRPQLDLWYQIDAHDADPARFFFLLREMAKAIGIHRLNSLPLLTPEYARDLDSFARRWFRELFAQVPVGSKLTLDNYHELPSTSVLHGALAAASEEIPPGCQMLILSWSAPPEEYARLALQQRLVEFDCRWLKVSTDELSGLCRGHKLDADQLRRLCAQCDGWIAGFTLLCQRSGDLHGLGPIDWNAGLQNVFNYFMAQVFRRTTPQQRELMIRAAFFPYFTIAMVAEIADGAMARELHEWLANRHLFVDRLPGGEAIYQYHSLFRAFLQNQAREFYTERGLSELCANLASILDRAGRPEEAIDLYLQGRHWHEACRLILQLAPILVATGRGKTMETWIAILPAADVTARPWLRYWLGMSMLGATPKKAQVIFSEAFASFSDHGDRHGQLLSAGGYIEAVLLAWDDLSPGLPWLSIIQELLADGIEFPNLEAEARLCGVLLDFVFWAAPRHELFDYCSARVLQLLAQPLESNQKLLTASYAIECFGAMGLVRQSRLVIAEVAETLKDPRLTVFSKVNWKVRQSYYLGYFGDYAELEDEMLELERQALDNGLAFLLAPVFMRLGEICLLRGAEGQALEMNERRRRHIGWIIKPSMVSSIEAHVAARRGELDLALECAMAGVVDVQRRHFSVVVPLYQTQLATVHICRGEYGQARAIINEILAQPEGGITTMNRVRCLANLAWLESLQGNAMACQDLARQALALARQAEFSALARMPLLDRWLCGEALANDIETSYVRGLVRNMRLAPEEPEPPNWPWPIRIYSLGRFEILKDDQPLEPARKSPQKLLALVKAIVAGGGKRIALSQLTDALWPGEEADSARQALEVALHRLRKLLGSEAYVLVHDGQISLDERYCWVDALTYGRLSDAADRAFQSGDKALASDLMERAIRLYGGEFLAGECEAAWALLFRDKLRRRFLRQVTQVGRRLQEAGRQEEALVAYEKGIEAEPLAEELYREIMNCHLRAGRKAEGMVAYRRLRQTLSVVLGIAPTAESEALYQKLH